jgi:hypothetical protein
MKEAVVEYNIRRTIPMTNDDFRELLNEAPLKLILWDELIHEENRLKQKELEKQKQKQSRKPRRRRR